jgi:hypothetical protein
MKESFIDRILPHGRDFHLFADARLSRRDWKSRNAPLSLTCPDSLEISEEMLADCLPPHSRVSEELSVTFASQNPAPT